MAGLLIESVSEGSSAKAAGILPGDMLLKINGSNIADTVDYLYFMGEERLSLSINRGGQGLEINILKSVEEDVGLIFQNGLGKIRLCANRCPFCFVEQLPPDMRKSLYVKDDDWRLSFLTGSYITLTNFTENDIDRIINRRVSPLYVSVHAADNELRRRLLGCSTKSGDVDILRRLTDAGIRIHAQIVLCPGINDGAALENTMGFLYALYPGVLSLSVVPVGLTGHRTGLEQIKSVDAACAKGIIRQVRLMQNKALSERGTRFVYASDEMYIKAGIKLPGEDEYGDFEQLENGVGLTAQFVAQADRALKLSSYKKKNGKTIAIATGEDFYPYMRRIAAKLSKKSGRRIAVYNVKNHFFGGGVTVAGLLTGSDYITCLKGCLTEDVLFLSASGFKDADGALLDGVTKEQLENSLNIPCMTIPSNGFALTEAVFNS